MSLLKNSLVAPSLALILSVNLFGQEIYTVETKTLKEALEIISKKSKLFYIAQDELIKGKKAPNIKNVEGVENALKELLKGSNLESVIKNDTIIIRKKRVDSQNTSKNNLGSYDVIANGVDGSAQEGYLAREITGIGQWGARSLQDTPYSVNVISSDLLENTVSGDLDQFIKMNPLAQSDSPSSAYHYPSSIVRGFWGENYVLDGSRLTGFPFGLATEEMERVEVLNGLSGFLYGSGSVGGITNYVLKRPTSERLTSLTLGNYGGQQYFAHVDLGGPIDEEGEFAYRLNAVYQDGDTVKENQDTEKKLLSGALDWNVNDNLQIQFEAAYNLQRINGRENVFNIDIDDKHPSASSFDTSVNYAPDWSFKETESNRASFNLNWNINEIFALRTAYLYKKDEQETLRGEGLYQSNGKWRVKQIHEAPYETYNKAASVYLDANFETASIEHNLTLGLFGNQTREKNYDDWHRVDTSSDIDLKDIVNIANPNLDGKVGSYKYRTNEKTKNLTIGDDIKFNDEWSALIGLNYSTIDTYSWGDSYKKSALTPSLSLIYKPFEELSTYVTYIESLEQGTIVDNTYKNAGKILDPIISKQYEIGAKYNITDNLAFNTALYRIEKANEHSDDGTDTGTYVQDGLQVHQGIELMLTGKLTDNLSIRAGATLLDAEVKKTSDDDLKGKRPDGVSERMFSIFSEYSVPQLKGLSLNGGVHYNGDYYVEEYNTKRFSSYTIADIGARYETKFDKYPTTFRVGVSNVTDKKYWQNQYSLGAPRTISFSVQMKF